MTKPPDCKFPKSRASPTSQLRNSVEMLGGLSLNETRASVNCDVGVIFTPNQEGDILDIQADIIGPGKFRAAYFTALLLTSCSTSIQWVLRTKAVFSSAN